MAVTDIKKLRESTGAGVLECKNALEGNSGDYQKAYDSLLKQGAVKAAKRESRETKDGLVGTYIHSNGKIGAMVEINCETDFVARNDLFQQLLKDVCMQVAALNPLVLRQEDISEETVMKQKEIITEEAKGKPAEIIEKIIKGKMDSFYKENCLLSQPFIKDNDKTILDLVTNVTAKTGEKVMISKFTRFQVGA
ncbi:MAG: translation elongation factor Ts [Candidatus Anammoxibacter sp.]